MDEKTFEILHWSIVNSVQNGAITMMDYKKAMAYLNSQIS